MAVYTNEFKFKLSKPIKYQVNVGGKNTFKDCEELVLRAPSMRNHYRVTNILQSLFSQAMMKAQKVMLDLASGLERPEKTGEESKEDSSGYKTLINFSIMNLGKEINEFYDTFEKLIVSDGICLLDSNKQFTEFELNSLDYEDFKNLVSDYILNFFIASWMRSLISN